MATQASKATDKGTQTEVQAEGMEAVVLGDLRGKLYSRTDVAAILGFTSQALANRISRDETFPEPSFSNANKEVVLYSKEDIKTIIEHMAAPDREKLKRLEEAAKNL